MVGVEKCQQALSAELEAHHRLCLEVSALQTELKGLKDGSWKRFQRPDPEEKKVSDVIAIPVAGPSKKIRLCACGCGMKRQCNGNEQESLPLLVGAEQEWTEGPLGADPVAQRAYHDKLAQPRKTKEPSEDFNSRCSSKQVVDPAYLERLAIPREKAKELSQKRRAGPVPKLPDLRGLQAKVIAENEHSGMPQKPQKPPPFIYCPARPTHSCSAPDLQLARSRPIGSLPPQCSIVPRPQRRLRASRPLGMDDLPGLSELRVRKSSDAKGIAMSLPLRSTGSESPKLKRNAYKQNVRTLDAQQLYIDKYLAAPPPPKGKHEALTMKLEALRNERLAREETSVPHSRLHESKSDKEQPIKAEEPVMPDVKWDLLI